MRSSAGGNSRPAALTIPIGNATSIGRQYTMNSLDVGDVNGDGHVDLVVAEHRGTKRLTVWQNDGRGNFIRQLVDEGRESHLGARLVDLDGDGDLDIVSIGYDSPQFIHLWRNDSASAAEADAPANEPADPKHP